MVFFFLLNIIFFLYIYGFFSPLLNILPNIFDEPKLAAPPSAAFPKNDKALATNGNKAANGRAPPFWFLFLALLYICR